MAHRKQDVVGEATVETALAKVVETRDELDEHLATQLVEHARAQGRSLVGPVGLLGKLTKLVFETGLEAEMSEHLGCQPHEAAGRNSGNSRNGIRSKTVIILSWRDGQGADLVVSGEDSVLDVAVSG